jgi:transposase
MTQPLSGHTSMQRAERGAVSVFGWRRKAMQAGVVQGEPHEQRLGFVEVTPTSTAMIEIVVADVVVRVAADIDQNQLVRILRAVRQA